MKAVIIGANSYIARNFVRSLDGREDLELSLYDAQAESADGRENYKTVNMADPEGTGVLDLHCDVVYMFVGKTGSANGFDDPELFIRVNELTLLNLLNEYRRQNSAAKIIFPSTRLVYSGKKGPQKEDAEKEAKTIYAANKLACERYLNMYHNVFGVRYAIVRICIPYGSLIPGVSSYGTAEFMMRKADAGENISLYGEGSSRRTLTYIGDLCELLYRVGESSLCENDVYNIGGEDYSLKEMAELIAQAKNVKTEFVPWPEVAERIESGDTVFDSEKLEKAVGGFTYRRFADWVSGNTAAVSGKGE